MQAGFFPYPGELPKNMIKVNVTKSRPEYFDRDDPQGVVNIKGNIDVGTGNLGMRIRRGDSAGHEKEK